MCLCVFVYLSVCVCVCACVRACVRTCMCVRKRNTKVLGYDDDSRNTQMLKRQQCSELPLYYISLTYLIEPTIRRIGTTDMRLNWVGTPSRVE